MCIQSKQSDLYINNTSKPVEQHTNGGLNNGQNPVFIGKNGAMLR